MTRRIWGAALYMGIMLALAAVLLAAQGWLCAPWRSRTAELPGGVTAALHAARFTLQKGEQTLYESEPGWRVEDFLVGDLDHDGGQDLALLVWRRGSFGPHLPFWQTERETTFSQHIFLYHLEADGMQPFWMSSALDPQVRRWAMDAHDDLEILTREGEQTRWGWRGWGLERLDQPPRRL